MGADITLETRVFIVRGGVIVGDRGLIEMLKAIDQHGSIRLAAQSLGMNYKKFWVKLGNAERLLGFELVERTRGRAGSRLTAEGRMLVEKYTKFLETLDKCLGK